MIAIDPLSALVRAIGAIVWMAVIGQTLFIRHEHVFANRPRRIALIVVTFAYTLAVAIGALVPLIPMDWVRSLFTAISASATVVGIVMLASPDKTFNGEDRRHHNIVITHPDRRLGSHD